MELRLSSARATKGIDLTYLQRVKNQDKLLSILILNNLQQLAASDLGDYFSYALGEAQLDLDNAPYAVIEIYERVKLTAFIPSYTLI